MYEKLEQCPLCKNTSFTNHLICTDHMVTGESFALTKCTKCDFLFTNPRPTEEHLPLYYKSDAYISHTNKANSLLNIVYKIVRTVTTRAKVKLITTYNRQPGKLLDYGSGTGYFITKAAQAKWQAYGIEPDDNARALIQETENCQTFKNLSGFNKKVDIITAWHVVEHIPDLMQTLQKLKSLLHDQGYLIIALPNHKSYDASIYAEHWAAYDTPRHLYHFDPDTVKEMARKLRMTIVDTLPMSFDSYYVSLLSEKNKTKRPNLLKALKTGYISNRKAKITGNYSSLIYILKK